MMGCNSACNPFLSAGVGRPEFNHGQIILNILDISRSMNILDGLFKIFLDIICIIWFIPERHPHIIGIHFGEPFVVFKIFGFYFIWAEEFKGPSHFMVFIDELICDYIITRE